MRKGIWKKLNPHEQQLTEDDKKAIYNGHLPAPTIEEEQTQEKVRKWIQDQVREPGAKGLDEESRAPPNLTNQKIIPGPPRNHIEPQKDFVARTLISNRTTDDGRPDKITEGTEIIVNGISTDQSGQEMAHGGLKDDTTYRWSYLRNTVGAD